MLFGKLSFIKNLTFNVNHTICVKTEEKNSFCSSFEDNERAEGPSVGSRGAVMILFTPDSPKLSSAVILEFKTKLGNKVLV